MAKSYPIELNNEDSLITVGATIYFANSTIDVELALDTGASHSVLDLNLLYQIGLRKNDALKKVAVQTASDKIECFIFRSEKFSALGKKVENMEISCYDFLQLGSADLYRGMLGLDFIRQTRLGIDLIDYKLRLRTR